MTKAANAIKAARDVLFPWSQAINGRGRYPYPGAFNGMLHLVGKQAATASVKDWLAGRRSAPRWLIKLLWDELERRIRQAREAQTLLENYEHGPGTGSHLPELARKKRAAQIEAARKQSEI